MLSLLAQLTPAPPAGQEVEWVISVLRWIVDQAQSKNWPAMVGAGVMVLVWAGRRFLPSRVSKQNAALLSAGLGVVATVGANLAALAVGAPVMNWLSVIVLGASSGATASGFWSLAGKKFADWLPAVLGKKKAEEKE